MAESDWSQPSSWSAGGGSMWGAPQQGMQSPYGGGWSGGGYMQTPYGGAYGGFGGGMPYGGGYGMQSPYGAPGGYGGYPMQSPYGMQSPYSAYGMPQQQSMMAAPQTAQTAAAPQTMAAAGDTVTPMAAGDNPVRDFFDFNIGGSTSQKTSFEPWEYQANMLRGLYQGELRDKDGNILEGQGWSKGLQGAADILREQQKEGPVGFDQATKDALARMQELAQGANPLVSGAYGTARDIASGAAGINTGNMWGDMYADPGIGGQQQYQAMAGQDAIGNAEQYRNMIGRDAIGNGQQYQSIYGQQQGPGSLTKGAYGQVASGSLMDSNPYRESAIRQSMRDTADQVKATMSSRGRFGSDAYGDAMGRALGQVATTARMQGYDTDTANMMAAAQGRSGEALSRDTLGLQAAQGLSSMQGTNAAQRLAQIQGLSGVQGQNYQARLGALGQMNQAQQMANQQRLAAAQGLTGVQGQNLQNRLSAAGMAPAMQGLRYDDAQRLLGVGAAREAEREQQRNFDWDTLDRYRAQIGNLPGTAGSQSAEASQPWWQQMLGAGAMAGGIWGQIPGMGGGG